MKPEPDEIDRIIRNAVRLPISEGISYRMAALRLRHDLAAAGYAIVLDEAQLLEKGAGVKLKP